MQGINSFGKLLEGGGIGLVLIVAIVVVGLYFVLRNSS